MRGFGRLLVIVGTAVGIAGVASLVAIVSAATGCADECHGELFLGAGSLLVIAAGLGGVFAGLALISQRSAPERERENRELDELRRRPTRANP